MNYRKASFVLLFGILTSTLYTNCSSYSSSNSSTAGTSSTPASGVSNGGGTSTPVTSAQANVVPITVSCGYLDEPCVSVTVCIPGTNTCQTIPNVLLDTGSYGLRLFNNYSTDGFQSAAGSLLPLPKKTNPAGGSGVVTECVSYADGSSDWGPVAMANVTLGGETASNVPVQIINANWGTVPSDCGDPDQGPTYDGFNGILGVGLFTADCGASCVTDANNRIYFSCPATGTGSCTAISLAESAQVTNPISMMPTDNNGVILELPSVAGSFGLADGVASLTGNMVMGIGTSSNNIPGSVSYFPADTYGDFITMFNGSTYSQSFIDSGSNALYFPKPTSVPTCSDATSFFCPSSELSFSAIQLGANYAGGSASISFNVGNADDMFSSSNPNSVFSDLAGQMSGTFDWGLPFFLGRNIYVGIDGKPSSLGTGPYWAY